VALKKRPYHDSHKSIRTRNDNNSFSSPSYSFICFSSIITCKNTTRIDISCINHTRGTSNKCNICYPSCYPYNKEQNSIPGKNPRRKRGSYISPFFSLIIIFCSNSIISCPKITSILGISKFQDIVRSSRIFSFWYDIKVG
jgi:hypothetical protein